MVAQFRGRVGFKNALNLWRPFVWPLFLCPIKMTPQREQFRRHAEKCNVVPVFRELLADMETPVSVFAKVMDMPECFLFESAENIDNWGRYSFIGCSPKAVFTLNGGCGALEFSDGRRVEANGGLDIGALSPLREYIAGRRCADIPELPRFYGGAVGYFGYECVRLFEKLPEPKGERVWDDARLALYDDIIIFDNLRHTAKIVACAHIDEFGSVDEAYDDASARVERLCEIFRSPRPADKPRAEAAKIALRSNMAREDYVSIVETAKEYIAQGEAIQVVLSQKFTAEADVDPLSAYRALRLINPSPYLFCLKRGGDCLVGSSPETLLRFKDGKAEVRPIAGTRRRGRDAREDAVLADELLRDAKERAEHLMLVDLGRNDLSRFCKAGSVQVGDFMTIERYSHVMHIVSDVFGEVEEGADAFDALAAAFPAGTLSGAPKIRAMQIINELEPERRGPYGGAVGYIGYGGNMDLAITIRTLQIRGGSVCVQAGAGIVFDSDPESEFEETRMKSRAIVRAVEKAAELQAADADKLRA